METLKAVVKSMWGAIDAPHKWLQVGCVYSSTRVALAIADALKEGKAIDAWAGTGVFAFTVFVFMIIGGVAKGAPLLDSLTRLFLAVRGGSTLPPAPPAPAA